MAEVRLSSIESWIRDWILCEEQLSLLQSKNHSLHNQGCLHGNFLCYALRRGHKSYHCIALLRFLWIQTCKVSDLRNILRARASCQIKIFRKPLIFQSFPHSQNLG